MADPLGVTASIVAVLDLAVKVTQYVNDVRGGSEDRLKLRDELRNTIYLLEILKDRTEDIDLKDTWAASIRSLGSPNGPLDQFRTTPESLVEKLAPPGKSKQTLQTLKWPFDKGHVVGLLNAIERQSLFSPLRFRMIICMYSPNHVSFICLRSASTLSEEIKSGLHGVTEGIAQLQLGQKGRNNTSQLSRILTLADQERRFRSQQDREICDWISPLNFRAKQSDVLDRRQEGTGSWLLEADDFKAWLNETERTLWCLGIHTFRIDIIYVSEAKLLTLVSAGAGKTVLA
jgi:hypothetical protein